MTMTTTRQVTHPRDPDRHRRDHNRHRMTHDGRWLAQQYPDDEILQRYVASVNDMRLRVGSVREMLRYDQIGDARNGASRERISRYAELIDELDEALGQRPGHWGRIS